ncbi:Lysocardiolipin acyltransferase 1 [Paragonimus heterotremus]|uniref:Lysocardiolipin acyltransferase 1 n=1 Tax=Paragonimus heterotremus TaxID=100268 RepID=A0A8J4T3K0_9TREM|nr:Lysocardiolipin acyltransferase 1 [Paragonimus heterotremus]
MANHINEIKQSTLANGDSLPSEKPLPVPPEHLPKCSLRGLRAGLCVGLLLISAYLGSIFLQGPLLPLAFIAPRLFRRTVDWTIASWLMFTEFLTVKLMQVRVRQFGDPFNTISDRPRVSLFLLNHRTQLDWFFSWGLGVPVQKMKIILKEPLARLPGAGWAMQCGAFVFLRRQIATDQARIVKLVSYLLNVDRNCELFMFSEGTDLNPVSLARSNEFSRKNQLPFVAYTMHPRCTGFVYLARLLGPDRLSDIYDVTVAYPDHLPSPETNILIGQVPKEVHYHVNRIPAAQLPWSSETAVEAGSTAEEELQNRLADWLQARWLAKESLLKEYYARPIGERCFEHEVPVYSRTFHTSLTTGKFQLTIIGLANVVFWFVFLPTFVYLLYTSWFVFIYACLIQTCFLYLTFITGGVSYWAARHLSGPVIEGPTLVRSNRISATNS